MDDEARFRVYNRLMRRIVWERRAYVGLWFTAGVLAGAGVTLLAYPRMPG